MAQMWSCAQRAYRIARQPGCVPAARKIHSIDGDALRDMGAKEVLRMAHNPKGLDWGVVSCSTSACDLRGTAECSRPICGPFHADNALQGKEDPF